MAAGTGQPVPGTPAGAVPVASIGSPARPVIGPGDDVGLSDFDLLIAARAAVDLAGVLPTHRPEDPVAAGPGRASGALTLSQWSHLRSSRRSTTSPSTTRPAPGRRLAPRPADASGSRLSKAAPTDPTVASRRSRPPGIASAPAIPSRTSSPRLLPRQWERTTGSPAEARKRRSAKAATATLSMRPTTGMKLGIRPRPETR